MNILAVYHFPLILNLSIFTTNKYLTIRSNIFIAIENNKRIASEIIHPINMLCIHHRHEFVFVIINFANGDMVGHTGVEEAAVRAVEAVDECIGKTLEALDEVGGQMFICADHGNCDCMVDESTGEPFTAHTTNPVPFILYGADPKYTLREGGVLSDIVPTLIELMGMEQPEEMTGKSLLILKDA